ncbi:hypothetical protein TrVE_jg7411 [Triparma verrucosa]|uniref:ABC1 atypical kinase-like domain-containing protein n=1 Tax=Triparma verrucosa TaxID=1606542 RepID=A0A9W7FCT8_9STRA|nr:hypothetical protein TrVE_jg7411 [Triparma verrucosa]
MHRSPHLIPLLVLLALLALLLSPSSAFLPPLSPPQSRSPRLPAATTDESTSSITPPPATSIPIPSATLLSEPPSAPRSKRSRLRSLFGLGPKDELESAAAAATEGLFDEICEVDENLPTEPVDPECADEELKRRSLRKITKSLARSLRLVADDEVTDDVALGDILEAGWERRGNANALRRNAEIWKFALKSVFASLKPRKLKKKGASQEEIETAQRDAATFIRDGLLKLGPSFVKLGQVVSTRTDVLPESFINVLKSLQDDVPPFSGEKAKRIVQEELKLTPAEFDAKFKDFSAVPLAAASLGQVHTAFVNGKKVAVKVQRSGLKDLFDVDLKNLKKIATLLNNFDPKTDGADRNWVKIYEESERLLYLEIDYLNEAKNAIRFKKDFEEIDYVRVPSVYSNLSTPRVLTMEFIESFKLTDIERIDKLNLDKTVLAKQTADSFLRQIVETGFFHCDPHPGNLCVDSAGKLVYYDFGMMDELKPNVREGFRTFCTALFAGGPMIKDAQLAENAKMLVDGVEEAGVLAGNADRLAVEKLARYFMRQFKDTQLGKSGNGIKETVGTDLQTLTENNVFRFPSTFTFIFRAFASIDGIGKGLDETYDIGQLAQPFIEKFTEVRKGYKSDFDKNLSIFSKATGLNPTDVEIAVSSPRRIRYVEQTLRQMEEGNLKIRVRSLENEKQLERMALTQSNMLNLLIASLALNVAATVGSPIVTGVAGLGAAKFALAAFTGNAKIKKFDKTQAKFTTTKFQGDE